MFSIPRNYMLSACVVALASTWIVDPVAGQDLPDLEAQIAELRSEIAEQKRTAADQAKVIATQQEEIKKLKYILDFPALAELRARGTNFQLDQSKDGASPPEPVGMDPGLEPPTATVAALPEGQGVLTRRGAIVFEPTFEYTKSTANRLVFRGIELIPGIQVGLIEASKADRDTLADTLSLRYGITSRLEVEGRVPFVHRRDTIEVVQQRDASIVRSIDLKGSGVGDVEMALRYQINRPRGQQPIWVAGVRVKSNTGKGPFEIPFDEFGVATALATGSGFWAVQPSLSMLLPSDPAVIFAGVSYLYHIPRTYDRSFGEDLIVGRVDPGDAISGNVGFGFALNPRFSYSMGYRHNYIFPTSTEINDTIQRSSALQVGTLNLGMSYRLTERVTMNLGIEVGVTEDAPDLNIALRFPIELGGF